MNLLVVSGPHRPIFVGFDVHIVLTKETGGSDDVPLVPLAPLPEGVRWAPVGDGEFDVTVTAVRFHREIGERLGDVDVILDGVAELIPALALQVLVCDRDAVLEFDHVLQGWRGFRNVPLHPQAEFVKVRVCLQCKPVHASIRPTVGGEHAAPAPIFDFIHVRPR